MRQLSSMVALVSDLCQIGKAQWGTACHELPSNVLVDALHFVSSGLRFTLSRWRHGFERRWGCQQKGRSDIDGPLAGRTRGV